MKKLISLLLFAVALMTVSCGESEVPANGTLETTDDGAQTFVLKGYESAAQGFSTCIPDEFRSPFYIVEKAFAGDAYAYIMTSDSRLDQMTTVPVDGSWNETAPIAEQTAYWVRYTDTEVYRFLKMRVIRIEGNNVSIEYVVVDQTAERPNENVNANDGSLYASATAYEMPRLNADYLYVDHYVTVGEAEVLNYALEWCPDKNHANWVAFSFDETTCQNNVNRTEAWGADPSLPEDLQVDNSFHTNDGFDRGHICASEDRVYSTDANKQTFYFSNISPQIASFNQGFWVGVENQVRKWGRAIPATYDKVYVTKGGTMNQLLVSFTGTEKGGDQQIPVTDANGFTSKGLACPKYYFVAVLAEKDGAFQAIGFLVPHQEDMPASPKAEELQMYTCSIDYLEEQTGLDFFCNLNDLVEDRVEASFNLNDWAW